MGAGGRDFHNFNILFRNNPDFEVIAFTATQIPNIDKRIYPASLAGFLYPKGIPIFPERDVAKLIKKNKVKEVIFSYSDVSHKGVMNKASLVLSLGADFRLVNPADTMLESKVSVVSVCAVRTGCGKSPVTRRIAKILKEAGKKAVVIRHPMPYGNLAKQKVQRFEGLEDLDKEDCTIEEREEYEPLINQGVVVYAGVDYEKILKEAEKEADIIIWDGGNNDTPFINPNLNIVVVDPYRVGHETSYHPGETNLRMADVILINKENTAKPVWVSELKKNIEAVNPEAVIINAHSDISVDKPEFIKDKRVLVVEDGPTITHGEMPYGAGLLAAKNYRAKEIIDPTAMARGSLRETFKRYPHIQGVIPAMGYGKEQIKDLESTIKTIYSDAIISATPIDLSRVIKISQPVVKVSYEIREIGKPDLSEVLKKSRLI